MLERIIAFTVHRGAVSVAGALMLAALGAWAVWGLPIDAFPDVTGVQVEVICTAPGLSAFDIESAVTRPVENALRGLPDLTTMRSVTKYGVAVVTLLFADGTDLLTARQLAFQRLGDIRNAVPEGVEVEMGPAATAMGEIYQYTLDAPLPPPGGDVERRSLAELRTLQDRVIAPLFKSVPGVSDVNSFGGYIRQFDVTLQPERLLKYDISAADVFEAIRRSNVSVGGNIIERDGGQSIVRGTGLVRGTADLEAVPVKAAGGTPVLLADVATVRVGEAVRNGAALIDHGREAVGGIVMMLPGRNGREVTAAVKEKAAEIAASGALPKGVTIRPYYDRSDIVGSSVTTVLRALAEGAIVVFLVLYLLLRSVRASLVVLVALPLALLLTFLIMRLAGLEANLMSLGGLAISIGMIIDTTIIQVENVQRRLAETVGGADTRRMAVLRGVLEVRKPSLLGELIIAVTFLPILTLEGMEGKMFTPLALTVAIALGASLLLSIFVVPAICALLLRPGQERHDRGVVAAVKRLYRPVLTAALAHRGRTAALAGAVLLAAAFAAARLGSEFMPVMDEGAFDMDVQLLPGVSLEQSLRITRAVEERLMRYPELRTIVGRTGQSGIALEARGVDKTGFTGVLRPRDEWRTTDDRDELTERMRRSLAGIPGMAFSFSQPIQCRIDELAAGTRAQLIVKLYGEDMEALQTAATEVAAVLRRVPGAADIVVERTAGQPYLTVEVDRAAAARHGLGAADVLDVVEVAVGGRSATRVVEGNAMTEVVVRYPEESRHSVEDIAATLVPTRGGYQVPLGTVASVAMTEGPVQITREDGERRLGIELNVRGRDIGGFVAEARERLGREVHVPAGVRIGWGGQFENQERAMTRLALIGPAAALLVVLLLFLTFRSLRRALLVLLNLPFALAGGVMALLVAGMYLSVPASVGFIVLFGVATLNGVVLVSRYAQLRDEGLPLEAALAAACEDRVRPVLMTATIAIASLLPMVAAQGPGAEVQRPLAAVVIGGLFTSTFATMVLMPVLISWVEGRQVRRLAERGSHPAA